MTYGNWSNLTICSSSSSSFSSVELAYRQVLSMFLHKMAPFLCMCDPWPRHSSRNCIIENCGGLTRPFVHLNAKTWHGPRSQQHRILIVACPHRLSCCIYYDCCMFHWFQLCSNMYTLLLCIRFFKWLTVPGNWTHCFIQGAIIIQ